MSKREQVSKFMKWYEGSLSDTDNCEAAYHLTEATWMSEFNGERFYKNYASFRTGRYHFIKYTKQFRKVVK